MRRVCVFCGSNKGNKSQYLLAARDLGKSIALRGMDLVYGGGGVGLMGDLAREVLHGGGEVLGVITEKIHHSIESLNITKLTIVKDMHQRKAKMYELADGFIALPGGLGTLEEILEVFTWAQLGYIQKPLALLNISGYYDLLLEFLEYSVEQGFIKRNHLDQLVVENHPEDILKAMEDHRNSFDSKWVET